MVTVQFCQVLNLWEVHSLQTNCSGFLRLHQVGSMVGSLPFSQNITVLSAYFMFSVYLNPWRTVQITEAPRSTLLGHHYKEVFLQINFHFDKFEFDSSTNNFNPNLVCCLSRRNVQALIYIIVFYCLNNDFWLVFN